MALSSELQRDGTCDIAYETTAKSLPDGSRILAQCPASSMFCVVFFSIVSAFAIEGSQVIGNDSLTNRIPSIDTLKLVELRRPNPNLRDKIKKPLWPNHRSVLITE
jgi:hypothetical protein